MLHVPGRQIIASFLSPLNLDADFIIKAFKPYRPQGFTSKWSIRNLIVWPQTFS
jgi:hypothetical protein